MSLQAELETETKTIINIYIFAKINFDHCYYLFNPKNEDEHQYLSVDDHLQEIRHSLWRITVIELAKLFTDNRDTHKFNLYKLISKLKNTGHYQNMNFSAIKINEWENILLSEKEVIENIKMLRNKMYAHTDPKQDQMIEDVIYFKQIEKLFALVESILTEIYFTAFGSGLSLEVPFRSEFDILEILAREHKKNYIELLNFGK